MFDNVIQEACDKVVKAVITHTISSRENIPLAQQELLGTAADLVGRPHLSLVQFDQVGYPLIDSLLPLAELWTQDSPEDSSDAGLTNLDIQIDDIRADLFDRLLNLSPNFDTHISLLPNSNPILNRIYEDVLRTAQFAGRVESNSPEAIAARAFLFTTDDAGNPIDTPVLKVYKEFQESVEELLLARSDASHKGEIDLVEILNSKILRTNTEWRETGNKATVEEAFVILQNADKDAGLEDERRHFIDVLEARKRFRLGSALNYAVVNIAPLKPLVELESNSGWIKIEIEKEGIKAALNPAIKNALELSLDDIDTALDFLSTIEFSYLPISLDREWLDQEFLTASYWRHGNLILSDGQGRGEIPTVATRAITVKDVKYLTVSKLTVTEGDLSPNHKTIRQFSSPSEIKSPLLTMLSNDRSAFLNASKTKLKPVTIQKIDAIASNLQITNQQIVTLSESSVPRRPILSPHLPSSLGGKIIGRGSSADVGLVPFGRKPVFTPPAGRKPIFVPSNISPIFPKIVDVDKKLLKVSVTCKLRGKKGATQEDLSRFKATVITDSGNSNPANLEIVTRASSEFFFRRQIEVEHGFGIILKLNDTVVATKNISSSEIKNNKYEMVWTVFSEQAESKLSLPKIPTLFGYAIELLPKAPNPNESLEWS